MTADVPEKYEFVKMLEPLATFEGPEINSSDIFEEDEEESFSGDTEKLISPKIISKMVDAFRDLLRGEERNNNLYRFILQGQKDAVIETAKVYFPKIVVVGLIAVQNVIDIYYEVNETWENQWEVLEPASEIETTIGYEESINCYEHGILELVNKETRERLNIFINTEAQRSYVKAYSVSGTGEASKFIRLVQNYIKDKDFYKNKTFTLKRSFNVGMIPKFLKSAAGTNPHLIVSDEIHETLQANVIDIFEKENEYRASKIPLKRGILLEGPPGCGKSSIVKYLEARLAGKVTIIYVTDGAIGNATDISEIYGLARQYSPSIVVLEDIDTIGLTRERGSNNFTSELLGQLDGLEALESVVTIATTNYPDLIDDALKNRPSRFDRRIKIDTPDEKIRAKMIREFLIEKDVDVESIDISKLASITKEFSGAMLKEIVITAKMTQVQKQLSQITTDTIKDAIKVAKDTFHDSKISSLKSTVGFRSDK